MSPESKELMRKKMSGENNAMFGKKRPEHSEFLKGKPNLGVSKANSDRSKGNTYNLGRKRMHNKFLNKMTNAHPDNIPQLISEGWEFGNLPK